MLEAPLDEGQRDENGDQMQAHEDAEKTGAIYTFIISNFDKRIVQYRFLLFKLCTSIEEAAGKAQPKALQRIVLPVLNILGREK